MKVNTPIILISDRATGVRDSFCQELVTGVQEIYLQELVTGVRESYLQELVTGVRVSYCHELVTTVTNILLVSQSVEMCLYCLEVKVCGDWELVRWERFQTVMNDHYFQEGITFCYPPMCKFQDGFKLLRKLIDTQMLTDDPCLVTQKMRSLIREKDTFGTTLRA